MEKEIKFLKQVKTNNKTKNFKEETIKPQNSLR